MKIENQLSTFCFSFLNLKKIKIEHRFSFFIFQLAEKMNDPKIHALEANPAPPEPKQDKPKEKCSRKQQRTSEEAHMAHMKM